MPSGHDAFYHARRILDAIDAPWRVVQFDTTIHAPEGSWVTWPWGYDAFMACIAGLARDVGLAPMNALVFVPPAWILVNAALLLGICRQLALSPAATWIAALCFACSPLTQDLHAVGAIDHHFIEYTFVLATLLAALHAFGSPERLLLPWAILGAVLGAANAVENGLFLLQLPVVATIGVLWLKGLAPGPRPAAAFAAALVSTTVLVALPSEPFRAGFLTYQLLSWFHVYVACLTSLAATLMARQQAGLSSALGIGGLLVLAALPLATEVAAGLSFVTTDMYATFHMPEMNGPFDRLFTAAGARFALERYSGLILLSPLMLVLAAAWAVRSRAPREVLFSIYALFGGLLMSQQFRFHQFGSFTLYVLPLVLLLHAPLSARAQRMALLCAGVVAVVAYVPAWARLRQSPEPGGNLDLALTLPLYRTLAQQCHTHPGIVLAESGDGHHIRFFTECPVIANNMVLSRQSWDKLRQSEHLLALDPARLPEEAPWVRYVLVQRTDNIFDTSLSPEEIARRNGALRRALLLPGGAWPSRFTLLDERRVRINDGSELVLARLFAVH
jgi:hypothetical protein